MPYQSDRVANNATGAVTVQRAQGTQAPVDTGAGGLLRGGFTQVAGVSGTPGANIPVDLLEQASNAIQGGRADLARTTGAERRLDALDQVGGGVGGGGGQQNANNAQGRPAQGNDGTNVAVMAAQGDGTGPKTSTGEQ